MTSRLTLLTLAACAGLCACASGPPEEAAVPRGRVNVFISPSGEPFRGSADAPYPVDVWFNRTDANHDGALTPEEFQADAVAFFHKLDLNGDGVIDGAELAAYEQQTAPEILPRIGRLTARDIPPLPSSSTDDPARLQQQAAAEAEQARRPRGPLMAGAQVFSVTHDPEPVASADADFDGKVTLAEWIAAARRHFGQLDLDHDGRITRAELPKTPAEKLADKAERRERRDHAKPPGGPPGR